jgi:outer membrane protein
MSEEMAPIVPAEPIAEKKDKKILIALAVGVLGLLIAVTALIFNIAGSPCNKPAGTTGTNNSDLRIAWINTDSIWTQYDFVDDVKAELAVYEKNLQDKYASEMTAFQNDYNAYIKKASAYQMTLDEQKKKEEQLAQKQQTLQELDAQLTQLLVDEKTARNMEVHDSIVNFIGRMNKDNKYTYIMERSYGGGILWADSTLEITNEVVKGLNEEYKAIKKEKEKAAPKAE